MPSAQKNAGMTMRRNRYMCLLCPSMLCFIKKGERAKSVGISASQTHYCVHVNGICVVINALAVLQDKEEREGPVGASTADTNTSKHQETARYMYCTAVLYFNTLSFLF